MKNILEQYSEKINGVFSFFDRMILTGYIRSFFHAMLYFLSEENILLKDYGDYAQKVTADIKQHVSLYTESLSRPLVYLNSPKISKEETARKCLEDSPVEEGLICTISTVELCNAFSVISNQQTHKLEIKCVKRKCLHYYFYYLDRVYGFMFVKLQTWFPFTLTVYINGRELMKKAFDQEGISYSMYDNSFSFISDIEKAQRIADSFDSQKLSRQLDHFARIVNPFLPKIQKIFGNGYYWCASQMEYATDVMFESREALEDLSPSMVGHSFYGMNCTDVFRFLGKKLTPNFHGEAVSDYKQRPAGCRVKFRLGANSIKAYDKSNCLRIETTINDPSVFKVYGEVHHRDGTTSKQWKPMGKTISYLYRYAQIARASNNRYLCSLQNVVPVRSAQEEIQQVCARKTENGKAYTGFNVWEKETLRMFRVISDGKYLLSGFTNKAICRQIYPQTFCDKRIRGKVTRLLKKLRVHGLIRKVPHSHRYNVSDKGRRIINSLLEMYEKYYPSAVSTQ